MTNKVYVIRGEYEYYDDICSWLVRAFYDELEAKKFCEGLNRLIKAVVMHPELEHILMLLDPGARPDFENIDYEVCDVQIGTGL